MLEVRGLHAGYGIAPVIEDISLTVAPGEILLIGGENGAGKTTLMRAIAGFNRPSRGEVLLDGAPLHGLAPERIAQKGLRLVLDGHRVFPELSVYDNLRMGAAARAADRRGFTAAVEEIYAIFPILKEKSRNYARDLSGGQQQMLALGQAFVAQPKALLCDEPSMGLAQALLPAILGFLRRWAQAGAAIVIVEQHLRLAAPFADRAMIVERGKTKFECVASELERRLEEARRAATPA